MANDSAALFEVSLPIGQLFRDNFMAQQVQ